MPCWRPISTSKTPACSTSMLSVSRISGGASRNSSACRNITKWKLQRPKKAALPLLGIVNECALCSLRLAKRREQARQICALEPATIPVVYSACIDWVKGEQTDLKTTSSDRDIDMLPTVEEA